MADWIHIYLIYFWLANSIIGFNASIIEFASCGLEISWFINIAANCSPISCFLGIIVSFLDISLASLVIINMFGVLTMTGVAVEESDRFFEYLKNEK